jgi:hypothetical protein
MNGKSHARELKKFRCFFQFRGKGNYSSRLWRQFLVTWNVCCNSRDRKSPRTRIFKLSFFPFAVFPWELIRPPRFYRVVDSWIPNPSPPGQPPSPQTFLLVELTNFCRPDNLIFSKLPQESGPKAAQTGQGKVTIDIGLYEDVCLSKDWD